MNENNLNNEIQEMRERAKKLAQAHKKNVGDLPEDVRQEILKLDVDYIIEPFSNFNSSTCTLVFRFRDKKRIYLCTMITSTPSLAWLLNEGELTAARCLSAANEPLMVCNYDPNDGLIVNPFPFCPSVEYKKEQFLDFQNHLKAIKKQNKMLEEN